MSNPYGTGLGLPVNGYYPSGSNTGSTGGTYGTGGITPTGGITGSTDNYAPPPTTGGYVGTPAAAGGYNTVAPPLAAVAPSQNPTTSRGVAPNTVVPVGAAGQYGSGSVLPNGAGPATGSTVPGGGVPGQHNSTLTAPNAGPAVGGVYRDCGLNVSLGTDLSPSIGSPRYTWSVDMTHDASDLVQLQSPGSTTVKYTVTTTRSSSPMPVFTVSGTVTVTNPSAEPIYATSVLAIFGGSGNITAPASCGSTGVPIIVPAKDRITCSFELDVPSQQPGEVAAAVITQAGAACFAQSVPYKFSSGSSSATAAPVQDAAGAAGTNGRCTILSVTLPRKDITVTNVKMDQDAATGDDGSSSSKKSGMITALSASGKILCKPSTFGFTASFGPFLANGTGSGCQQYVVSD